MKRKILLFFCLISFGSLHAQNIVTGTVTEEGTNEPLIGVGVAVKGTTAGTQTSGEGTFSINAPQDGILVFTYLGFTTKEVPINNQPNITVSLVASSQELQQVVVVGYGVQRKQDVTGSIARVDGAELAKQPVQTATQALQGKAAGVQIIGSGQPNSQPQVRIRGTGSILGGANPLYVVDGVLTEDIRNLNNSDILSVDVLKDASAAIYGVRAANGVIIITTKKGKAGEVVVNYDASAGFRQASNLVKMADRNQYLDFLQVAAPNKLTTLAADEQSGLIYGGSTDWFDQVLRSGYQTQQNISVSGGSEKNTFFISGGFIGEDGIVKTNNFNRITFRANNDVTLSDKFKLSTQLNFSRANERAVQMGDNYRNVYRASPLVPSQIDGRYGNTPAYQSVGNPLLSLDKRNQGILNNRLLGNIALEYKPVSALTFRSAFNTDLVFNKDRTYNYQYLPDANTFLVAGGSQQQINSLLSLNENKSVRYVWDNTATYSQTFDKHSVTVLAGAVTERFQSDFISGQRINIPPSEDQWYLGLGNPDDQLQNGGGGDLQTRQSFVGRLNYAFDNKYLLTASLRADGTSKFREKWGYFPTVGLGWNISQEEFMKDQKLFSNLKLRGSWGLLGNDNIASNLYITTADINIPYYFNNGLNLGTAIQEIRDQNLRWERTEQFDIGLEFGFLDNRLTGEIDYYNKRVIDALARVGIPGIFGDGDGYYITNVASFRNRGYEGQLAWKDNLSDNLSYRVGGNITFNRNEVIGLNGGQAVPGGEVGQQSFVTRTDNGQPVGSFYVLDNIGVFQSQSEIDNSPVFGNRVNVQVGDLKYRDVSGPDGVPDGIIDNFDRVYAGSYQPKMYFGINLGLDYKNFDITADFFGNAGNQIYNGKKAFRFQPTDNIEADFANNRWTPSNPSSTNPRNITASTPASTYFIESGTFFRLNNLTLGYSLPESLIGKKISRLRVYLTSQNLFTLQRFSGFSPELLPATDTADPAGALGSGIELNAYPTTRTFAFGVNIGL